MWALKLHLYLVLVLEGKLQKRSGIYSLFESRYCVVGGIIFNNSFLSPWKAPQTQQISNQNQQLRVLDVHSCIYVSGTLTWYFWGRENVAARGCSKMVCKEKGEENMCFIHYGEKKQIITYNGVLLDIIEILLGGKERRISGKYLLQ